MCFAGTIATLYQAFYLDCVEVPLLAALPKRNHLAREPNSGLAMRMEPFRFRKQDSGRHTCMNIRHTTAHYILRIDKHCGYETIIDDLRNASSGKSFSFEGQHFDVSKHL